MTATGREHPLRVVVIDDAIETRDQLRVGLSRAGMPVMDGVEAPSRIRELVPGAQIIVFSAFDSEVSRKLLDSAADGHLTKGTPLKDIVAYVEEKVGAVPSARLGR